jgi:membrane-bound toxin of toxin-antitoxin system
MTRIVFKIEIVRSQSLLTYFIVLHCLMLVTMLSLLRISWWSLLVFIMIMLSGVYYCHQNQWFKSCKALNKIERDASDKWVMSYQDGKQHSELMLTRSFVTPHLVILYFNKSRIWQRYAVTIVFDAVDKELFRQLRVYLLDPKTFHQ